MKGIGVFRGRWNIRSGGLDPENFGIRLRGFLCGDKWVYSPYGYPVHFIEKFRRWRLML